MVVPLFADTIVDTRHWHEKNALHTTSSTPLARLYSAPRTLANTATTPSNRSIDSNTFYPFSSEAPFDNLWEKVRSNRQLHFMHNKRIAKQLKYYSRNSRFLPKISERAQPYLFHIVNELEQRNMPLELALLPAVESAYDPFAYSHGRASGMWQFIPSTGKSLGLKQNWWYDGRRDIVASTDAALNYLSKLHRRFDGDWLLAMAAYNGGQATVARAIRKNVANGKATDYWSLKLPKETMTYVPKLIALAKLLDDKTIFDSIAPVENAPYFSRINIGSQLDLAQAAELAGIDIHQLYTLNPAYNHWATAPEGPHTLLIPKINAETFRQNLASFPTDQRIQWSRYTIKAGDSLSTIAQRYDSDTKTLRRVNKLKTTNIRVGKVLFIPKASKNAEHYKLSIDQRLASRNKGRSNRHKKIYTVKAGDSLWLIAKQHKLSSRKIAYWNNMATKDPIKPGQKLNLWLNGVKPSDAMVKKIAYKVRRGDSLARIANKFNLRIKDILTWNDVNKAKYLQPGQGLTLYVDITKAYL